jgi:beta-glucanase (GH16 family)
MKSNYQIIILFSFVMLGFFSSCDEVEEVGGCQLVESLDQYELVWSDEFDGETIDESKWSFDIGDGCDRGEGLCGWGNNELQYYTDSPENAYVEDGKLVIRAKKEIPFFLGQYQYTSARMVTKNKGDWTYGRIDVRAKMPLGKGLWPAAWMLPTDTVYGIWPKSGEIDIMEYLGDEPNRVFGTIHYGHDFWRFNSQYLELEEGTFAEDFHVFSAIWNENCIQFLMDDQPIGEPNTRSTTLPTTWPFDQPFHMILNIAVGGNLPGNPDGTTQFPQTMEVDYVRVYQEK